MDKLLIPEAIDTSGSPIFGDLPQDTIHVDTMSDYAARVLEIFPDVEPMSMFYNFPT
jgi:hypothetical protein